MLALVTSIVRGLREPKLSLCHTAFFPSGAGQTESPSRCPKVGFCGIWKISLGRQARYSSKRSWPLHSQLCLTPLENTCLVCGPLRATKPICLPQSLNSWLLLSHHTAYETFIGL